MFSVFRTFIYDLFTVNNSAIWIGWNFSFDGQSLSKKEKDWFSYMFNRYDEIDNKTFNKIFSPVKTYVPYNYEIVAQN